MRLMCRQLARVIAPPKAPGATGKRASWRYIKRIFYDARIMKLVPAQNGASREKRVRRVNAQLAVSMTLRSVEGFNVHREDVRHRIPRSLPAQAAGQQHQSAAFSIDGQACSASLSKRREQTRVQRESRGMGF